MLICASLRLWGETLDPNEATQLFGVPASRSQHKGQIRKTITDKEVTAKTGIWQFSVQDDPSIPERSLSEHLCTLRKRLDRGWQRVKDINGLDNACIDIYIALAEEEGDGSTCAFDLSPANIHDLKQVNLPIQFTIDFIKQPPLT